MVTTSVRDIGDLTREELLDDYLKIARGRGDALVATALRTKSVSMRDILTYAAVGRPISSAQLKDQVLAGALLTSQVVDIMALADLGRLVLLQDLLDEDLSYGEALLTCAHDLATPGQLSIDNRRVLIQHQILSGNHEIATRLLDSSPDIDSEFHRYLRAETLNPFTDAESGSYEDWLHNFNSFFTEQGFYPVDLEERDGLPFDRLTSPAVSVGHTELNDTVLVSVVLTAYKPEEEQLISSVRSILNQTWRNFELIVVDDCSGPEYAPVFDRVRQLDPRIKIIYAPVNRGTYVARNIGYAASSGDFITGQDDDDWSHPQRIARQLEFMQTNPEYIGCRVMAIRCDDNLGRCRVGYRPVVLNPSSLMIRREGYEQVGNYLESRKGADSEYYFRLKAVSGGRVANLKEPLSVIRILPDSLSRGDFSAGWRHPSRSAFRSAYRYWHRGSTREELKLTPGSKPKIKIPQRFGTAPNAEKHTSFDVVFAGDWQRYGGPQKSMLEEIYALVQDNYRVGVMNLEAARFMTDGPSDPLNDEVQRLVNDGIVEHVQYDDDVHIRLLVLRYPPILQFFTHEPSAVKVDRMLIVANQAPSELDGSDIRYRVEDCQRNAEIAFGIVPTWVPQGPQVRDFLELYLSSPVLAPFDMPGILNPESWWHDRIWYRSSIPVVGRHSRDDEMKWPEQSGVLKELYRTDGAYDVRIMGGHRTPLRVMGSRRVPLAWTVYKKDAMPVSDFLYSLDYFVFFQHTQAVEAFGRAVLEALAAGIVVILPRQFERVFGEAALYANPSEVRGIIQELHSDFSIYQAQLERSRASLREKFSYPAYRGLIRSVLARSGF